MIIGFRADASIDIGSGHIMRCLTLADALTKLGHECIFICRNYHGNLIQLLNKYNYRVIQLDDNPPIFTTTNTSVYSQWLGTTEEADALECRIQISKANLYFDWLVIDHYSLSSKWELQLQNYTSKIFVIDDLANRSHSADMLLDCGLTHQIQDYEKNSIKVNTHYLLGPQYVILRPEFNQFRKNLLPFPSIKNNTLRILINLGGVDKSNITLKILKILNNISCTYNFELTIVMGVSAPWLAEVKNIAQNLKYKATVLVGVNNMAELMTQHHLAIGAAGSTAWERCCVGLPTIMICMAENQQMIANNLNDLGAAISLQQDELDFCLPNILTNLGEYQLHKMREKALKITNGLGTQLIINCMCREFI